TGRAASAPVAPPLRHAPTPVGWRATRATVRAANTSTRARIRTSHAGSAAAGAVVWVGSRAGWAHASTAGRVARGAGLRWRCLRRGPPAPGWPRSPAGGGVGGCGGVPSRPPSTRGKPEPEPGPRSRSFVRWALHLDRGPEPGSPEGRVDGRRDGSGQRGAAGRRLLVGGIGAVEGAGEGWDDGQGEG